jgi:hypothetical protein
MDWTWASKENAVTVDDFRSMALRLPDATESAHMSPRQQISQLLNDNWLSQAL